MKISYLIAFSAFLQISATLFQATPLQTVQEKVNDLNTRKVPQTEQIQVLEKLLADQSINADENAKKSVIVNIDRICSNLLIELRSDYLKNKSSFLERVEMLKKFRQTYAKLASPSIQNRIASEISNAYNGFISEQLNAFQKNKKMTYQEIFRELRNFLVEYPDMNQYPAVRYSIHSNIISYCLEPQGWTTLPRFNYKFADTEMKPSVDAILNDPEMKPGAKIFAADKYVKYLCAKERFDEAETLAKSILDLPGSQTDKAQAYVVLSEVYRFQYKYDQAMETVKQAIKCHPVTGKKAGSTLALKFDKPQVAIAIWGNQDQCEMLRFFTGYSIPKMAEYYKQIQQIAAAFVLNPANLPQERLEIMRLYCLSADIPEYKNARKVLPELLKETKFDFKRDPGFIRCMTRNFQLGDYALTAEIGHCFAEHNLFNNIKQQNMYIISLGAIGRKAEAAQWAQKWAVQEKIAAVDVARFRFYEAILLGQSTDKIPVKDLTRKELSSLYLSAARQTLTWNMSDLSEKYTAEYEKFFASWEQRGITVKYSDTPVSSIAVWRKLYPELEKQYCDIPYRGSMEFLETDVSTGNRSINKQADKNSKSKFLELTAVCDRYGLHIFLRAEAGNARDIERGFASGISTEMYFAPGKNQPYICMGGGAAAVDFIWQSTYNHKKHTRINENDAKNSFRKESEFTGQDYVLHLFFAWDNYYNKLPENEPWRFECLAWAPNGGFSWGGSQGIHSASAWGDLNFHLNKKQWAEIKRELIFKTYRSYKMVSKSPGVNENLFQCWADNQIGDPVFYDKYLKDLETELDSYKNMVKKDMSDDDVLMIYQKAYERWKGLPHEIDALRQRYLVESLNLQNQ